MEQEERKKPHGTKKLRRSLVYMVQWFLLHRLVVGHRSLPTLVLRRVGRRAMTPQEVCQRAGLTFSASLAFYFTDEAAFYPPPKRIYRKLSKSLDIAFGTAPEQWAAFVVKEARTNEFKSLTPPEKVLRAIDFLLPSVLSNIADAGALPFGFTLFSSIGDMLGLARGTEVMKYGGASGRTQGVIEEVDVNGGVTMILPAQPHLPFAHSGDMGSLCFTTHGQLVGVVSNVSPADGRVLVQLLAQDDLFESKPPPKTVQRAREFIIPLAFGRVFTDPFKNAPAGEDEAFANFRSLVMCSSMTSIDRILSMRVIDASSSHLAEERIRTLEMVFAKEKVDAGEARELLLDYCSRYPFDLHSVRIVAIATEPLHYFLPPVRISAENRSGTLGGIVRSADGPSYGITAHHVAFAINEDDVTSEPEGTHEEGEVSSTRSDKTTIGEEEEESEEEGEEDVSTIEIETEVPMVEVRAHYTTPTAADTTYPFTLLVAPAAGLQSKFLGYGVSLPLFQPRDVALVELDTRLAFTVGALQQPVGKFTLFPSLHDMEDLAGREVVKYGCRTGHTQGIIEHVQIESGIAFIVSAQPLSQPFAQRGDSGSLCITAQGQLVGIVSRSTTDGVFVQLLAQEDLEGLD